MKPEIEQILWVNIASGKTPRESIELMVTAGIINSPEQAWRTLEKWARKGLYDYGVSLDLGWLTDVDPEQL